MRYSLLSTRQCSLEAYTSVHPLRDAGRLRSPERQLVPPSQAPELPEMGEAASKALPPLAVKGGAWGTDPGQ